MIIWSFFLIKVDFQGPTFLHAQMPSTSPTMFHSTTKRKPMDFFQNSMKENLWVKVLPSYTIAQDSCNFNCRHHQHLDTRKIQCASNKHHHTWRTSELVFTIQNVQRLKQDLTDLNILTHYIENQSWKPQVSITFLSECHLKTNKQLLIFIHRESSSTGGVGIVLNKQATHAWKSASSQTPVH